MKTLFIDFDGTICHDRFWRSLPAAEYDEVQRVLFNENHQLVREWMCGVHSAEEITRFVSDNTGIAYQQLWHALVRDCSSMHIPTDILEVVKELRNTFHTVLITGNMDSFDRFTVPALGLDTHFDAIVNSWSEGRLKTEEDGATFRKYLKGPIEHAILIEDSPNACRVFKHLGGTAHRVTSETDALHQLNAIQNTTTASS